MFKLETCVEFNEVKATGRRDDDDKKVLSGQLRVNATVPIADVIQLYGYNLSEDQFAEMFWAGSGHPKSTAKNGLTFGAKIEHVAVRLHESFLEAPKKELFACDDVTLTGFKAVFHEGLTLKLSFNMHCKALTEKQQGKLSSLVKENVYLVAAERQGSLELEDDEAEAA